MKDGPVDDWSNEELLASHRSNPTTTGYEVAEQRTVWQEIMSRMTNTTPVREPYLCPPCIESAGTDDPHPCVSATGKMAHMFPGCSCRGNHKGVVNDSPRRQPENRPLCVNCFARPAQNRCKECEKGISEFFSEGPTHQPDDLKIVEAIVRFVWDELKLYKHGWDELGDLQKQLTSGIMRRLLNRPIDPDHLATILVKSIMEIRWPCTLDDMPKAIAFVRERLIHAYAIRGVVETALGSGDLLAEAVKAKEDAQSEHDDISNQYDFKVAENERLQKQVADLQSRLDVVRHFNKPTDQGTDEADHG